MAYASKELKAKIAALIKQFAKDEGIKLGVSVSLHDCQKIRVNIKSCSVDLKANLEETLQKIVNDPMSLPLNEYNYAKKLAERNANATIEDIEQYYGIDFSRENLGLCFSGKALNVMQKVLECVKCDYKDESDYSRGYSDVSYYWDVFLGRNKNGFSVVA